MAFRPDIRISSYVYLFVLAYYKLSLDVTHYLYIFVLANDKLSLHVTHYLYIFALVNDKLLLHVTHYRSRDALMLLVLDDGDVHGYAVISEPGGMIRVAELQIIYHSECLS